MNCFISLPIDQFDLPILEINTEEPVESFINSQEETHNNLENEGKILQLTPQSII